MATLIACAAAIAVIACTIGFIDHARCEFDCALARAFNP
jgi:hypothetical protein